MTQYLNAFINGASIYNHRPNILTLFDALPNFPLTASETKRNY